MRVGSNGPELTTRDALLGAVTAWPVPAGGVNVDFVDTNVRVDSDDTARAYVTADVTTRDPQTARQTLDYYEMTKVTAHLHHGPLTRRLILSGPADDFQSSELVRIMGDLPGVSNARWSAKGGGLPLIVEGMAAAVLGFLLGLLLAYLVELRRRYNSQWNW